MAESRREKLNEAAVEGNVTTLLELLQQDQLLLTRLNYLNDFNETPLHVASLLGHLTFVHELLKRSPRLAKELDSRGCSALHFAAAGGFLDIVKILVRVDPDMCSICNQDGMNPIHLAAMRGRVDVLAKLVRVRPAAARTPVDGGGTVLHLCVKYNQLEALKMLIETIGVKDRDNGFINSQDDYGFSILHLAVSNKQLQTVKYLINNNSKIQVNAKTSNGLTALDILSQSHRDLKDMDIAETLTAAKAVRTTNKKPPPPPSSSNCVEKKKRTGLRWAFSALFHGGDWWFPNETSEWLMKQESLMVVASLIATMAFQAGMSPPGGVLGDDSPGAGTSVMAAKDEETYQKYLVANSIGFMTSFIAIVMILIGLPKKRIFMRFLIMTMCAAVCSMAFTYGYSIRFFTPLSPGISPAPSPEPVQAGSVTNAGYKPKSVISLISVIVAIVVTSSMVVFLIGKLVYVHSRENKSTEHPDPPL